MNAIILKKEQVWPATARLIHEAIHDPLVNEVILPNEDSLLTKYKIEVATNGCRKIIYNGISFMEQNKNKVGSRYADLANAGHKITWGIRSRNWIYIIDGEIKRS